MRWLSWLIVIGACLLVGAALALYKYNQISAAQARAAAFPEPMETVEVFEVMSAQRKPSVRVTGEIVPVRSAQLRTELAGRVSSVGFAPGAAVSAGQVLVQLDVTEERARLAEARASQDIARLALNRARRLVQSGAGSVEARDRAQAEFDAATARVSALNASIAKKTVVAPFDALAGLHRLEVGQYLEAGAPVTDLIGTDDIAWVDFPIPQEFSRPFIGLQVIVSNGTLSSEATIIARDSTVSSASRNLRLRAEIRDDQQQLLPGMLVEVEVPLGAEQTVTMVPATSVRRDALGTAVYVLQEVSAGQRTEVRARKRGVQLARDADTPSADDLVIVESGLEPGELIAATGAFKLRDGALVNLLEPSDVSPERVVGH